MGRSSGLRSYGYTGETVEKNVEKEALGQELTGTQEILPENPVKGSF